MLNSVVLVGRAGADAEIKYFESGRAKTTFSLAVDRPVKRTEGAETTDWFRIELWDKRAESAAEWVKKGKLLGITGRLENASWTDAAGQKQQMPVIVANDFRLLGSKSDNAGGGWGSGDRRGGGDFDPGF
ncbi:MAG: single-stranded DNA-binding protein [Candidatus Sericytochromatia bacterium]|nr:single-stranded DNA-binding protein [Candidatus Sericytochromatia bacterium]